MISSVFLSYIFNLKIRYYAHRQIGTWHRANGRPVGKSTSNDCVHPREWTYRFWTIAIYGIETRKSYTVRILRDKSMYVLNRPLEIRDTCWCAHYVFNGVEVKLQQHLQVLLPGNLSSTYMKAFCHCCTVQHTVSSCYILSLSVYIYIIYVWYMFFSSTYLSSLLHFAFKIKIQ